jgi:hypothetical protein
MKIKNFVLEYHPAIHHTISINQQKLKGFQIENYNICPSDAPLYESISTAASCKKKILLR